MAKNPHILYHNCPEASTLSELLGDQWSTQEIGSFTEADEMVQENPESILITQADEAGKFNEWNAQNKSVAVFLVIEEDIPKVQGNVIDWIRYPIGKDELIQRIEVGYRRFRDHLHLVKYSQKIIRDRNIQSQMNDRLLKVSIELKIAKEEIERLSLTDSLTQLKNRRFFDFQLERDILQAARYKTPLSMFILDIDNFKHINDTFGHQVGDDVLIDLANVIKSSLRDTDWAARYGGEEFCVILPMTEKEGAQKSASRIRESIENQMKASDGKTITASIGLATYNPAKMDQEKFIYYADQALFAAKKTGKNKVVYFEEMKNEYLEYSSGKPQPSYR